MTNKSRNLDTPAGPIKLVSLKQFITKIVPTYYCEEEAVQYVQRLSNVPYITDFESDDGAIRYTKKTAFLHRNRFDYHRMNIMNHADIVRSDLEGQGETNSETIENLAVYSLENFMEPDTLVCLGGRRYMVCNASQVKLYVNHKSGLATLIFLETPYYIDIPISVENHEKRWGKDALSLVMGEDSKDKTAFGKFLIKSFGTLISGEKNG